MKRHHIAVIVITIVVAVLAFFLITDAMPASFVAHLSGQSVLPAVNTLALGDVTFRLNRAGDELSFTLTVNNIENVTEAHLHLGSIVDSTGQRLANLYAGPDRPGRTDGVIARGTIKQSDLKGPLIDQPLSALIALFGDGLVYVDIHTQQNPAGEIRGQIR